MIIYRRAVCSESCTYGSGTAPFILFYTKGSEFHPAWPNDLFYMFPVAIFGTFACAIGLAVLDPAGVGEPANPFATPLEILRATRYLGTSRISC